MDTNDRDTQADDPFDPQDFDYFMQTSYHPHLTDCQRKEAFYDFTFQLLQWITIVLSTLTVIFVSIQELFSPDSSFTFFFKFAAIVSSIITTMVATVLKTFNYQKKLTHYSGRIADLKAEHSDFISRAKDYAGLSRDERKRLFIQKISGIIREGERDITAIYGGTV